MSFLATPTWQARAGALLAVALAITSCGEGSPTHPGRDAPVLSSVDPDTILAADPIRLVLTGTRLAEGQILHWNDYEFPVQESEVWGVFVDLPVWSVLLEPGTYEIAVQESEAGRRISDPLDVVVVDRHPLIRDLSPASAPAGSGPITLTVKARFLGEGSQVAWNGVPRPTERVDERTLRVDLTASDLATAGAAAVTVTKNGIDASQAIGFPILSAGAPTISSLDTLSLETTGLTADNHRNLLYALVSQSAPTHAGEFVAIDPSTGSIRWSHQVGDASHPVVTEDGSSAYLALSSGSVLRVDLNEEVATTLTRMPAGTVEVRDIVAIPGRPRQIAVALQRDASSPRVPTVVVVDDGNLRPDRVGGFEDMDRLEPSTRETRIYAYGSGELRTLRLLPTGITIVERSSVGYYQGLGTEMIHANGWLFGTNGRVVDAEWAIPVGRFSVEGPVRPDAANGRVHFLAGNELRTMHMLTHAELGSLSVPEATGSTVLVRFGSDGLAFGGGERLVLLRSGLIGD